MLWMHLFVLRGPLLTNKKALMKDRLIKQEFSHGYMCITMMQNKEENDTEIIHS